MGGGETVEDRELLETLRKTPERGMGILMEQYGGLVWAVARGRLSGGVFCAADIENCAADAFSEFYLGLDRYDLEKGSIRSWLCVIVRNKALDLVRQRYREANILPLEEGVTDSETLLESSLEERELREVVLAAVKELGEPDREIVLRKYYLGEPSQEIAARLRMSVSNVNTRTHRAIQKLREKLKEWR